MLIISNDDAEERNGETMPTDAKVLCTEGGGV